jgi:hypothetical protein
MLWLQLAHGERYLPSSRLTASAEWPERRVYDVTDTSIDLSLRGRRQARLRLRRPPSGPHVSGCPAYDGRPLPARVLVGPGGSSVPYRALWAAGHLQSAGVNPPAVS